MIKPSGSIEETKKFINSLKDKKVKVQVNLGRNKSAEFFGVLSGVYPALFTVKPDDENYLGKTSYSYAEYLCGRVKIKSNETII